MDSSQNLIKNGMLTIGLVESSGVKTGWGVVILSELVAIVAAGTVHQVCITTWKNLKQEGPELTVLRRATV
ncbi:hypothetical protein AgCh_024565 [Apium graveolens]